MLPPPKIIKSSRFEDGTYSIKAPVHPLPLIEASGFEVDPRLLAAERESKTLVDNAKAAAEARLAEVEGQLVAIEQELREQIETERQQVLEAARLEGFQKGEAQGLEAGQQAVLDQHAAALARLAQGVETAAAERTHWFEAQEKDLTKLALLIAQKILIVELATSRDAVVKMAEAAITHITDKTQVRLRAHPLDVARLNAARGQLVLSTDNMSHLEIVGDPAVGLGGCMIETRTGLVDARLSTQLAEIAAKLLDIMPGPDGASDFDPTVLAAVRALGEGGHVLASGPKAAPAPAPAPVAQAPAPVPVMPEPPARQTASAETLAAPAVQAGQAAALAAAFQAPAAAAPLVMPLPTFTPPAPVEPVQEWTPEPVPTPAPQPVVVEAPPAPPVAVEQAAAAPQQSVVEVSENAPQVQLPPELLPRGPRPMDPSKRAADALAARLGKLKRGKGVSTLAEEYDMTKFEGTLADEQLEAIVRSTTRNVPATEIGSDEVLVHNPYSLEDAADVLAEKLGKKKRRVATNAAGDEISREQLDEALEGALADSKIDEILGTLNPRIEPTPAEAVEAPPPDLDRASEALAKLLGKNKKRSNRAWYDQ